MRVLVLVKATDANENGVTPPAWTRDMLEAMGRFNDDLRRAGILLDVAGLASSAHGRRVVFDGEERTVVDGPFQPAAELVAGYWLWQVTDMDEAVAWVRRCPNPIPVPSVIEIRPLHEAVDLRSARAEDAS